jgi:anti-anti-sigma factor
MAELDNERTGLQIDNGVDSSGVPVLQLSGDLDIAGADALEAAVAQIAAQGPAELVFDLTDLRFMDSAGIAVLVGASRDIGAVQLRNPSAIVRRIVELTGLTDTLPIAP